MKRTTILLTDIIGDYHREELHDLAGELETRVSRIFRLCLATSPGSRVTAMTAGLLVVAVGVLLLDRTECSGGNRDVARGFQRMAGGLGLGATVRPRWCFVNFDPRVEHCTCTEQPLPGGYCYCPEHTGTVSFFVVQKTTALDRDEEETPGP